MMERTLSLTFPELGMIGATRAAAGAGLALLLADRLARPQRRIVGWMLLAFGAISTIPLVAGVVLRGRREATERPPWEREAEVARH
jgi:hypothetical protein